MHIKHLFPEISRPRSNKKDKLARHDQENARSSTSVESQPRPTNSAKRVPSFPQITMRRHSSTPNMKPKSHKKLSSVEEEEEIAFNYQMTLLEDSDEWELDAGIGSKTFESTSLTPPAFTTSRASSPSKMEKMAESSKKRLQKFTSMIQTPSEDYPPKGDDRRLSKSLPDLSKLSGKGNAGNLTKSNPDYRGRSKSVDESGGVHRTRSRSGPPSWRMPPRNIVRKMPHVREAVPPPSFPFGPVEIKHHESSVMARTMWKNGEVRYEDQWGRRLVPVGRHNSFMFELWPVSEMTEEDGTGKAVFMKDNRK